MRSPILHILCHGVSTPRAPADACAVVDSSASRWWVADSSASRWCCDWPALLRSRWWWQRWWWTTWHLHQCGGCVAGLWLLRGCLGRALHLFLGRLLNRSSWLRGLQLRASRNSRCARVGGSILTLRSTATFPREFQQSLELLLTIPFCCGISAGLFPCKAAVIIVAHCHNLERRY